MVRSSDEPQPRRASIETTSDGLVVDELGYERDPESYVRHVAAELGEFALVHEFVSGCHRRRAGSHIWRWAELFDRLATELWDEYEFEQGNGLNGRKPTVTMVAEAVASRDYVEHPETWRARYPSRDGQLDPKLVHAAGQRVWSSLKLLQKPAK